MPKRQRTAALQNLEANRPGHGADAPCSALLSNPRGLHSSLGLGQLVRTVAGFSHHLGFLRGLRRFVNHGVGVFDATAVSPALLLENAHERVVMLLVLPIALPFEQSRNGC